MGCFGRGRNKDGRSELEEQKWNYITLTDFRTSSTKAKLSYVWLWCLSTIAIAVYVADTFTAVNLLAFNKWSSQVDPAIKVSISKWIFTGCIMFSWVLCIFEWVRALRVIRTGNVADSYLDPLAATLQSSRIYSGGHGWRRFLVFAELTKSKKGTDYLALFVYFQFKGAVRVVLAEGPRQVVNAMTLWAVMKANILLEGKHAATGSTSAIDQFWNNVEALAEQDKQQAVILGSMAFTLIIWVFSAFCLFLAATLYVVFLWHYVPSKDGSLSNYCRRKVDKRLERIVSAKTKAAIEHEIEKRRKEEELAIKSEERATRAQQNRQQRGKLQPATGRQQPPNGPRHVVPRKPTLPVLSSPLNEKAEFEFKRTDTGSTMATMTTLPPYSSQPPTRSNTPGSATTMHRPPPMPRQPTLPSLNEDMQRPGMPPRSETEVSGWSAASYQSDAPLLSSAANMSYDMPVRTQSPAIKPPMGRNRSLTAGSNGSYAPPMPRNTPGPGMPMGPGGYGLPMRPPTAQERASPAPSMGMPMRPGTAQGRLGSPAPGMVMGPGGYGPRYNSPAPGGYDPRYNSPAPGGYDPRYNSPGPGMPMYPDGYGPPMRSDTGFSTGRPMPGPSPLANPDMGYNIYDRRSPAPGPMQIPEPAYEMQQPQRPMMPYQNEPTEMVYPGHHVNEVEDYDPYRTVTPMPMPPTTGSSHSHTPSDPISMDGVMPAEPTSALATMSSSNEAAQRASGVYMAYNPYANAAPAQPEPPRTTSVSPLNETEVQAHTGQYPVAGIAAAALAAARQDVSPLYEEPTTYGYQQPRSCSHSRSNSRNVSPLYEGQVAYDFEHTRNNSNVSSLSNGSRTARRTSVLPEHARSDSRGRRASMTPEHTRSTSSSTSRGRRASVAIPEHTRTSSSTSRGRRASVALPEHTRSASSSTSSASSGRRSMSAKRATAPPEQMRNAFSHVRVKSLGEAYTIPGSRGPGYGAGFSVQQMQRRQTAPMGLTLPTSYTDGNPYGGMDVPPLPVEAAAQRRPSQPLLRGSMVMPDIEEQRPLQGYEQQQQQRWL